MYTILIALLVTAYFQSQSAMSVNKDTMLKNINHNLENTMKAKNDYLTSVVDYILYFKNATRNDKIDYLASVLEVTFNTNATQAAKNNYLKLILENIYNLRNISEAIDKTPNDSNNQDFKHISLNTISLDNSNQQETNRIEQNPINTNEIDNKNIQKTIGTEQTSMNAVQNNKTIVPAENFGAKTEQTPISAVQANNPNMNKTIKSENIPMSTMPNNKTVDDLGVIFGDSCNAIPAALTAPKNNQLAWNKCIEYQEKYVYPCENPKLSLSNQRGNYCDHEALVPGDINSTNNNYNYVVSLGYGVETKLRWFCGGTLISDKFVLTAAFCLRTDSFVLTFIYLGPPPLQGESIDRLKLYRIKRLIPHERYRNPDIYNDIGLIEIEETIKFNNNLKPVCLHTGEPLNYYKATLISRDFATDDFHTMKLQLTNVGEQICSLEYPASRAGNDGYEDRLQMCFQDIRNETRMCRRDFGSPLLVKSDKINCMNVIIGVSSIIRGCTSPIPSIITRVSAYLSWIEYNVWRSINNNK